MSPVVILSSWRTVTPPDISEGSDAMTESALTEGATSRAGPSPGDSTTLTFSNPLATVTTVGRRESDGRLTVRAYELPVPDGTETVTGRLIGYASSHRDRHSPHPMTHARPGEKCPACRWFEVRIFRLEPADDQRGVYAVHTQGPSRVPGEIVKCRLVFAQTGYEVIELLTVRQDSVFLPAASSRALSQAAGLDRGIETAYVNRAVA
jgi:hypothetical protein